MASDKTTDSKDGKKTKRAYRQPVIVLFQKDELFYAAIAHPSKKIPDHAVKTSEIGIHTAIGMWRDIGYSFGQIQTEFPDFAIEKLPKDAKRIGVRIITAVPFPV